MKQLARRFRSLFRTPEPPPAPPEAPDSGPMRLAATFDPHWYISAHGDENRLPIKTSAEAYGHYLRHGAAAGMAPNVLFREDWYLESNADVAQAVAEGAYRSGWDHYRLTGRHDGRFPNGLLVEEDWYLGRYADVAAEIEGGRTRNAREHYLEVGASEGRDPHPAFDEAWYLGQHPEVLAQVEGGRYLSGYQYLLERGLSRGHLPHPLFDDGHYRFLNPDIDAAVAEGDGYLHLIANGLREGRRWKTEDAESELRRAASKLALCRLDELLCTPRELLFRRPEAPVVSIILVLFNRAELTLGCLESLLRLDGPPFEVIVVDNASTDHTGQLLERFRGIEVLRNVDNTGFVLAANQGAAMARGELLLFLNNDVEVLPSSVRAAVERLHSDDGIGAVGARVVGLDGRLQEAGSIVWSDGSTEGYGRGDEARSGAYLFCREVDYCSGVFLLTRRASFEALGGFDPAFAPAYYEEADYCFRLRQRGLRTVYEPDSVLVHFGWASLPDESRLMRMLARNRSVFLERHGGTVALHRPVEAANRFAASDRRTFRGRVLYLDDTIPLESEGSGSPRAQQILHLLCELGYAVTMFATNPSKVDVRAVRRELTGPALELIGHLGRPRFAEFWSCRRGSYDLLIVSRWHNLQALFDGGFDPETDSVRLIYDAECLTAVRDELRSQILELEATEGPLLGAAEEIALARRAPEIWAVSRAEAARLEAPRCRVSVVAHGVSTTADSASFEERRGVLFVGRLDESWNPNVDALRWYLSEIHPLVESRLGAVPVTVVGDVRRLDLPPFAGVRFVGRVDELSLLFARHRVFVAPTRFAAGIPLKILTAAANGLPVVATTLLAQQLEWEDGIELLDGGDNDPQRFADAVASVHLDRALWTSLQQRAWERIARDYSLESLRRSLVNALEREDS